MDELRIAVIGVGNIGSAHTANLYGGGVKGARLTALCDTDPDKREALAGKYPDIKIYAGAEELFEAGACDAVIISVPHRLHAPIGIKAFEAGLHVLCEKPIGVSVSDAIALISASEKNGRVFSMMFNQRTNPVFRKAKELVESGAVGSIKRAVWLINNWYRSQAYYNSGGWRATWSGEGGGVLLNQCPHNLDLWQWIFGLPTRVRASCYEGKYHNIEVEDDVTIYAEYANGSTGTFITTTGDGYGTNLFEIQMDKAKLVAEGDKLTVLEFNMSEPEFTKTNTKPFGHLEVTEVEVETDGLNPQHIGVLNAWAGAILRGTPLVANGVEGINGVQLSNAMHMSAFLGKTVELPVDENEYYEELMKRVATSRRKENVNAVFADTADTYGSKTKK